MVAEAPAFKPYQYESVLWIHITLMRIRILLCRFDADPDPDPSFQIKAPNLEKVLKYTFRLIICKLMRIWIQLIPLMRIRIQIIAQKN